MECEEDVNGSRGRVGSRVLRSSSAQLVIILQKRFTLPSSHRQRRLQSGHEAEKKLPPSPSRCPTVAQARVPMRPIPSCLVVVGRSRVSPGTRRMRPIMCVFASHRLAPPTGVAPLTFGLGKRTSLTSSPTHKHLNTPTLAIHWGDSRNLRKDPERQLSGFRLAPHELTRMPIQAAPESCPRHYPAPPRHRAPRYSLHAELETLAERPAHRSPSTNPTNIP